MKGLTSPPDTYGKEPLNMFYSGDENHTDQVTSGPIDEDRQHIWDSDDGWCRLHRTYCEF